MLANAPGWLEFFTATIPTPYLFDIFMQYLIAFIPAAWPKALFASNIPSAGYFFLNLKWGLGFFLPFIAELT